MFTINNNNVAKTSRFALDMLKHLIEFVTSKDNFHTMNIDSFIDADGFDVIGDGVLRDDDYKEIEFKFQKYTPTLVLNDPVSTEKISKLSGVVRTNEGNVKYNIVLKIFDLNSLFELGKNYSITYNTSDKIYLRASSKTVDGVLFDVIGASNLSLLQSIINNPTYFKTFESFNIYIINIPESGGNDIGGNVDFIEFGTIPLNLKMGDYIRIFDNNNIQKYQVKISYIDRANNFVRFDKYININTSDWNFKCYNFVSVTSPKLVKSNYISLPTLNYLNRFINDNKEVIDLMGDTLMITPSTLKVLSEEGASEVLVHNDKYIKLYTNGENLSDGFYVVNFRYNKVVSNNDIQYKIVAKLNNDVMPNFQKIGGVVIKNKQVRSYFLDSQNKNSNIDIYYYYKKFFNNIEKGYMKNVIKVNKDDSFNTVVAKINNNESNVLQLTRQDITEVMTALNLKNVVNRIYKYNNSYIMDVIVLNEDGFTDIHRVDKDNYFLFKSFDVLYKLH